MNALNWFEIPVVDIERAATFYSAILGAEVRTGEAGSGPQMATLPSKDGVGGALVQGEGYTPSAHGALVYLNGGADCGVILSRVQAAGGKVLRPKTDIGEYGFFGTFLDTEGNRIAVHSMG